MKKRVGVWILVSTKLPQHSNGPEHHLQKAKNVCRTQRLGDYKEYHREAISSKKCDISL